MGFEDIFGGGDRDYNDNRFKFTGVARTALTVQAPSLSVSYGDGIPTTFTPTYAGFVNGDTAASLTTPAVCSTTATAGSAAGVYLITCDGATSPNYAVAYTAGALTIDKAALTVAATDASRLYAIAPQDLRGPR